MIKMNRKIEYSLIALKHLYAKRPGELTTTKEVCDTYRAPFDVMAKVLQVLSQAQWLKSVAGAQGGYLLLRDLSKVSLLDLITLFEGPFELTRCLTDSEACELLGKCNIVSPIQNLNDRIVDFYGSLSVQEVLEPQKISIKKT